MLAGLYGRGTGSDWRREHSCEIYLITARRRNASQNVLMRRTKRASRSNLLCCNHPGPRHETNHNDQAASEPSDHCRTDGRNPCERKCAANWQRSSGPSAGPCGMRSMPCSRWKGPFHQCRGAGVRRYRKRPRNDECGTDGCTANVASLHAKFYNRGPRCSEYHRLHHILSLKRK